MPTRRSLLAPARAQTRWLMATPYADGNFHTRNIRAFLEEVQTATQGRLQVQLHSNGSLLPMPQIKGGVQRAQVQMGEVLISAYGNEDPFFEVDGIPQLVTSYNEARRLNEIIRWCSSRASTWCGSASSSCCWSKWRRYRRRSASTCS